MQNSESLWDENWSKASTEVWFEEGEPGVLGLKVGEVEMLDGKSYVVVEYIKPNSQAANRAEVQLGQWVVAVNSTSTSRVSAADVQSLLTPERPLRLLLRYRIGPSDSSHDKMMAESPRRSLRSILCCGRKGHIPAACEPVTALVNANERSDTKFDDDSASNIAPFQPWNVPIPTPKYDYLKVPMPLRQQAMPTLVLPNADPQHWMAVQGALCDSRPTTLSELRQRLNRYAGGLLGYQGRKKLSVAGLSELLRLFPEMHGTFLPFIVPHLVAKIDALTDFCRKALEKGTGWRRGVWQGTPIWFNQKLQRYQRRP
eukprot:SAG31_NODE_10065_length_1188_cov_1.604224_2_plen_313_part_01